MPAGLANITASCPDDIDPVAAGAYGRVACYGARQRRLISCTIAAGAYSRFAFYGAKRYF